MRTSRDLQSGLSYVELLIVVAMVGLLGAVALPRYRQADTMTKYAQVLDNFGQIKVALDAYNVDAGVFPETDMGMSYYVAGKRSIHRLTTPVAYLPSIPASPFTEAFASFEPRAERNVLYARSFLFDSTTIEPNFSNDFWAFAFQHSGLSGALMTAVRENKWSLRSCGPDGIDDRGSAAPGYGTGARVYDVTNGIASRGDIVWFSNRQLSQTFVTEAGSDWQQYQ